MLLHRNDDWDAAVQLVEKAGDPMALLVPRNNWYRLRRNLEILRSSGSPPSAFSVPYDAFKEHLDKKIICNPHSGTSVTADVQEKVSVDLDYDFICFFLSSQRVDLYKQIDLRCEEMLTRGKGILSEATWLLDLGLLPNMNSATRAIGYRQAMEYLVNCREQGGSSPGEFYTFLISRKRLGENSTVSWMLYHSKSGNIVVPESGRLKN